MGTESEKYNKSDVLEAIRKLANEKSLRSRTEFLVKLLKQYDLNISTLRRYMLELGIKKTDGVYKLPDEVELKLQREELSSLFYKANLEVINKDINFTFIFVKPYYIELLIHEFRNHPMLNDNIISMIPSTDGILVITNDLGEFKKEIKKIRNIND